MTHSRRRTAHASDETSFWTGHGDLDRLQHQLWFVLKLQQQGEINHREASQSYRRILEGEGSAVMAELERICLSGHVKIS